MSNYMSVVTTERMGKVKNVSEVLRVFHLLGFDETTAYCTDEVNICGYDCSLCDEKAIIVEKGSHKIVAVEVGFEVFMDINENFIDEEGFLDELNDPDPKKYDRLNPYEYLQEQLLDGEVMALIEVGNEKLRYSCADILVVSKKGIEFENSNHIISEKIKALS